MISRKDKREQLRMELQKLFPIDVPEEKAWNNETREVLVFIGCIVHGDLKGRNILCRDCIPVKDGTISLEDRWDRVLLHILDWWLKDARPMNPSPLKFFNHHAIISTSISILFKKEVLNVPRGQSGKIAVIEICLKIMMGILAINRGWPACILRMYLKHIKESWNWVIANYTLGVNLAMDIVLEEMLIAHGTIADNMMSKLFTYLFRVYHKQLYSRANSYHINILESSTVEELVEKTFQNYGRAKIFEHSTENCIDLDRIMHPIVRYFGRYSRPLLKSMYAAIEGIDDPADIPNVCYKLGCISNKSTRELEDEDKLEREQKVENKSGE